MARRSMQFCAGAISDRDRFFVDMISPEGFVNTGEV
jgi:hypothetical protein